MLAVVLASCHFLQPKLEQEKFMQWKQAQWLNMQRLVWDTHMAASFSDHNPSSPVLVVKWPCQGSSQGGRGLGRSGSHWHIETFHRLKGLGWLGPTACEPPPFSLSEGLSQLAYWHTKICCVLEGFSWLDPVAYGPSPSPLPLLRNLTYSPPNTTALVSPTPSLGPLPFFPPAAADKCTQLMRGSPRKLVNANFLKARVAIILKGDQE